jgi:DNA-binding transcriptional ArsR family regulator
VLLEAVSSPIRREILWLVWNDELAAGEIADVFDVTAPTVSAHLAALTAAGLVRRRVDGNFRRYRANRDAMALLVPLLASGDERWQPADDIPERGLADSSIEHWVQVAVDVPVPPAVVFEDFTDDARYSAWLGVPVSLRDGRFPRGARVGHEGSWSLRGRRGAVAHRDAVGLR